MPLTNSHVGDLVARPARTTAQVAAGLFLAELLNPHLPHLMDGQKAWLGGVLAVLLGTLQLAIENQWPALALLRKVPEKDVPVVNAAEDDEPSREPEPDLADAVRRGVKAALREHNEERRK